MNILLDTHVVLWALTNDPGLSQRAKDLISDPDNEIFYSIISMWEVQIKHMLHPEQFTLCGKDFNDYCLRSGYSLLSLKPDHITGLAGLKTINDEPVHKDPFDRIMICQAISENMIFLTHDSLLKQYEEPCVFNM